MCGRNVFSKCVFSFGLGMAVSSFFVKGIALFLVGAAAVILSFALRER